MQPVTSGPVNLLGTLTESSSSSYTRRVVAHILGHAMAEGLTTMDARTMWAQLGYDPELWAEKYRDVAWAVKTIRSHR